MLRRCYPLLSARIQLVYSISYVWGVVPRKVALEADLRAFVRYN